MKCFRLLNFLLFNVLFVCIVNEGYCQTVTLTKGAAVSPNLISINTTPAATSSVCRATTYRLTITGGPRHITWTNGIIGTNPSTGGIVGQATDAQVTFVDLAISPTAGASESIVVRDNSNAIDESTYSLAPVDVPNHGVPDPTIGSGQFVTGVCQETAPVFTTSCTGTPGTNTAGGPCYDNVGAIPLTYAWSNSVSGATSTASSYTIPASDVSAIANFIVSVTMTNANQDITGSYCAATTELLVPVLPKPDLSAVSFGGGATTSAICVYDEEDIIVECANCNDVNDVYKWQMKGTTGNWSDIPTSAITATTYTGTPLVRTITVDPEQGTYTGATGGTSTIPITPDLYDIRVRVINDEGCNSGYVSRDEIFTVNDRPSVEVYHNGGGGGTWNGGAHITSSDNVIVCAGSEIEFTHNSCGHQDYVLANIYPGNYSTGIGPNIESVGSPTNTPIPYDDICVTQSGNQDQLHFKELTWTATAENGTTTIPMIAFGTGGNTATNPNSFNDRTGVATASMDGVVSGTNSVVYRLDVEADNGCVNYDEIIVQTEDAAIDFEYPTGTSVGASPTISVCRNTTPTIRANCASCGSGLSYTWSVVSGSGGIASGASSQDIVINGQTGATGSSTVYQVSVTGNTCEGIDYVTVTIGDGPGLSLTTASACEGSPIVFTNGSHVTSTTYEVFDGDPDNGGSVITSSSTSNTISVTNNLSPGSHTYWVRATLSGCTAKASRSFTVVASPEFDAASLTAPIDETCAGQAAIFEAEATGGAAPLNYAWVATGTPSPSGQMGTASSSGATGYYTWVFSGWFPVLVFVPVSATNNNYTFNSDLPPQTGVGLVLTVTDDNGCEIDHSWGFDVIGCGVPSMTKTKGNTPTNAAPPTGTSFRYYGCFNDNVFLNIDVPNADFNPIIYEWYQNGTLLVGETDSFYTYPINPSSPDTIFTLCKVSKEINGGAGTEIVGVQFDTTIVSRPFINLYPTNDNIIGTVDTLICLNEYVESEANCYGCKGNIQYIWDSNLSGNTYSNGNIVDSYSFQGLIPGAQFDILLTIMHGEDCEDDYSRQVYVNEAPIISLLNQGQSLNGAIYLCDGDIEILTVDTTACSTCDSSTFVWNTTATTIDINVVSPGGYYAEVRDSNTCLGVTDVAIVIDANDGLNSAAIVNPSQVCAGDDVLLEVSPCVGCTYEWFTNSPPNSTRVDISRTHQTNVPGTYYAEVTNSYGCIYPTLPLTVTTTTLTIPSIAGTTDSICQGETTTLYTTAVAGASYQWYLEGGVISGATDTNYVTSDSGNYFVAITYPNGCIAESPNFNVYDVSFKPNITAANLTVVCSNNTADLYTDLVPGWQYQWYDDGNLIPGANGSIYSAITPGAHYVEVQTSYGCVERSDSIYITTSSLPVPSATTSTPNICPNEFGKVSVSLCSGCFYQWFNANTGLAITNNSRLNYRYDSIEVTGDYYAVVSKGGCEEYSDTVNITLNSVITPAINTSSTVVCDGRDALLVTPSCVGCTYHWLNDTVPVLGSLNDTFHLVDAINEAGNYQISVDYPNGCSDTSAILNIENGSDTVLLTVPSLDSVICNTVGESLLATPQSNLTGTYFYTLFLDNTPVTGYSNVTSTSFPGDHEGVYTIEMINPLGCKAISNLLPLRTVDIIPVLSSRATSNPNAVAATAICTDTGSIYLEIEVSPNCPNCTYEWRRASLIIPGNTGTSYTTDQGAAGAGLYIVNVTDDGCTASSNPISIADAIGTLDSEANTTDTSICNGQSVTLEHAASMNNPSANCIGCSFRWLRTLNPINGASNYQYVTSTPGTYNLEVTTADGCVDTSSNISIRQVDPPSGLTLNFDSLNLVTGPLTTGTPLASNGSIIDMNNWVFPPYARHDLGNPDFNSYFTSTPFNGALFANAGLQGTDNINFLPDDSLSGFHLITYYYDTLGCTFTTSDVLEVNAPAAISVTNLNPVSVAYEACVGDNLVINTTNLDFAIDEVFVFDTNDDYQTMPLNSTTSNPDTFGVNIRWNTTINLTVEGDAYASYLMLVGPNLVTGTRDTTYTSFVLIHNTDLSFTGLPNMLCSNGEGIPLFGSPTGGSFYAESTSGTLISGAFVGDTLYPQQFNQAAYVDGNQYVDIYYSYTESYTNGQSCPDDDTVSIRKEVKDVRLTDVQFNTISVSQTQELLTNLVSQTTPYAARPNKQPLYTSTFSGSFTNPAGNPTDFLPADAGVGTHALTYRIQSGDCINSVEDSITVVPAPTPIPIPDTICRNYGTTSFAREIAVFPYGSPTTSYPPNTAVASYTDEFNIISVTGAGVVAGNTNVGSETYTYNPTLVTGNYDTLIIEYGFYRDEDTLDVMGVPVDFDTLEYVVAQIIKPIYIEDTVNVNIIDTIVSPFYCQENTLHLLAGNPSSNAFGGGLFMLYGGTNQYQFGDTLHNSVINPYDVNNLENATTTYDLVYVLNGAACNNSDTMSVTIGRGLTPAFATANGLDEFCDTDPNVVITHNVSAPDTAILTIGGVPQPSYVFGPGPLDPGLHVVELQQLYTYIQATDTFVCSASAIDTFTIHALPALTVTPSLDNQYCANDTIVDIVVGPTPGCPLYTGPGHIILDEKFDVGGIPPSWNSTFNISGKNWVATPLLPQGGTGNAAFIDTSQVLNDSWLITKPLDLVGGHTYRLTYMVRAGELDPTCSGLCDAQLSVGIGNSATAPMASTLVPLIIVDNDQTYVRYTVEHYHDTLTGFATGQYYIGFRSVTPALGRSLRLDNVRMRDMTLDNCSLEGIGYMSGPGVHNVADSLYQFNPLAVPAGNVEVKYVYTDVRGCQDSLVFPIKVDTAPIVSFTDLPATYCENEPTLLITGSPLGGAFTSTIGTNLVPVGLAILDTANFPVNYQTNTTGVDIVSYFFEDNNLCSETVHDTIYIVPLLDSMFISSSLDPFGNGHCVDADSTILNVSPFPVSSGTIITNGTFYGAGVRNGAAGAGLATFYPDSAEIDMGHIGDVTIDYIYTTTTGCADTTQFTTRVHALPDLSFMNLPDSMCLNQDSFQVVAINNVVAGSMGQLMYADTLINNAGQFNATDTNGVQLPNFIQLFDTLYPYTADGYSQVNVSYSYTASPAFGLCSSTIYDSVRIDSVPQVYFQDLRPYYCENEPASIFLAFPAFSVGSGYLLIDSTQVDSSFFWIDPATMVGPGMTTAVYPTYYTFTDTRGCRGEAYDTFEVRPYPRITFDPAAQDTFCRQVGLYDLRQMVTAPLGGYFTDNLALTSIQDSFYLNLNSLAGPRLVTYHYTDPLTLCQNQDTIRLYLFNSPEIDFTIYGGCAQMDITFDGVANNLEAGIDSITRIWWDFEGNGIITNSHLDTSAITIPDTTYQYATNGIYNVTMNVQNQGSCPASITKSLIVSPYYDLTTDYFEDFDAGAGDWYDDQPIGVTPNNIWTHENSLTSNFISNSNGFWVTMAAEPYYEVSQAAWVYSPCFDFTNSQRPMIALDLWRDVLPGIDGAVLEFYNNTTNNWEVVGNVGEGIDWYQSDFVLGRPGNQLTSTFPLGWTGRSNGSESARLRLDQFKGQRDIRLRIAFATSSQTVIDSISGNGYEGVAFDNVWIGERTRNVLVEHFDHVDYVNDNSLTSSFINQSVYNKIFNTVNGLDVILIQYQAEDQSLGTDPIYSTNPADLSSRQYQYSSEPNNIFVDGRTIGDGLSESLDQSDLDYDMLQFPDFDIQIATPVTIVNDVLSTSATVEALVAKDSMTTYTTRVAVIQDSFTYVNSSHMLSVFRKMLPNNGGTRKTDGWQLGEQQSITQSLTLSTLGQQVPVNETQLEVIVFVQNANDNDRTVYQAATTQDLNRYIGTTKLEDDLASEIFDLNVYPNPSSDLFNVEFDKALDGEYTWRLVDVTGRVLQTGMTAIGTKKFTIDAEPLVDGAYFFIINSDDNRAYAQRKLIVIK